MNLNINYFRYYYTSIKIVLFFCVLSNDVLHAQKMCTYERKVERGSNNMVKILINSKNEVHIVYDKGIKKIENFFDFEIKSASEVNNIYSVIQVQDKMIGMSNRTNSIYLCEGDQKKSVKIKQDDFSCFFNDYKTDDLYFITKENEIYKIDSKDFSYKPVVKINDENVMKNAENLLYYTFNPITKKHRLLVGKKDLEYWEFDEKGCHLLSKLGKGEIFNLFFTKDDREVIYRDREGFFIIQKNNKKYYLKKDKSFPARMPYIKIARQSGNAFLINFNEHDRKSENITYKLDMNTFETQAIYRYNSTDYVIDYLVDRNNTFWAISPTTIIRVFPYIVKYNSTDFDALQNISTIVKGKDDKLWISNYGSGICYMKDGKFNKVGAPLNRFKKFVNANKTDDDGNIYFTVDDDVYKSIKVDKKGNVTPYQDFKPAAYFKCANGDWLVGTFDKGCFIEHKNGKLESLSEKGLYYKAIGVIEQDENDNFWLAKTSQGIAYYDVKKNKISHFGTDNGYKNLMIRASVKDDRGGLWFGSTDSLYFFPKEGIVDDKFAPSKNFIKIACPTMGYISDIAKFGKYLIIGGEHKSSLIDLDNFYQSNYTRHKVFELKDVPITTASMFIDEHKILWGGMNDVLTKVDLTQVIIDTLPPKVSIDSVKVGELKFGGDISTLDLDVNQHTINIFFNINYVPYYFDNVTLYYRLNNQAKKMLNPNTKKLELNYLSPTQHVLEIIAVKNGLEYLVRTININIHPEYWKRPLFWLVIIGLLSSIFGLVYKNRVDKQRFDLERSQSLLEKQQIELENIKQEQTLLKTQVLINQLNPHFLNNVMQMIQVHLYPKMEAIQVIDKLTSNIDLIFRNSIKNKVSHSLSEELRIVSNYLFIQNKRFNNKLILKFPSNEEIEKFGEVGIFLMNIQIHVENAIEHGIRNRENSGFIGLDLEDTGDYLKIRITDDGAGRKKAGVIGSRGTQKGTVILAELMGMFNRINENKIYSTYEDEVFEDAFGNKYGTHVLIFLPKNYCFDLNMVEAMAI